MDRILRLPFLALLFFSCVWSSCARFEKVYEDRDAVILKGRFFPAEDKAFDYYYLDYKRRGRSGKFPVLFALHGTGGDGEKYIADWKDEAVRRRIVVIAPNRVYAIGESSDMGDYYSLIEKILEKYPSGSNRLYVAGVSSGAIAARSLLLDRPAFWKGGVLIAAPTDWGWIERMEEGEWPPILFVHGHKDEQFAYERTLKSIELLREKGVRAALLDDPEAGHTHKPEWNAAIFDWLEEHAGLRKVAGGGL